LVGCTEFVTSTGLVDAARQKSEAQSERPKMMQSSLPCIQTTEAKKAKKLRFECVMEYPGQSGRLKWSKRAEYELQKELMQIARAKCDAQIRAFAECATEQGPMVIFRCRQQNNAMKACVFANTDDDSFEAYKLKREKELDAESRQSLPQ